MTRVSQESVTPIIHYSSFQRPLGPRLESILTEEQLLDPAQDFLNLDRCGEKAVATQDAAGEHLTFRFEAIQADHWGFAKRCVAFDFAGQSRSIRTGRRAIEQNQIRLEPARGMQCEAAVMLFFDPVLPRSL